jgi:RNA 2',3'-cyclic 3'-phosphodiesterase
VRAPGATISTTALEPAAPVRLFVAAWPDEETRERLGALPLARGKGLRLVGPTHWHVTVRFLGDVDEALVDPVADALTRATTALPGPARCRLGPATDWFTGVRVLQVPAAGLDEVAAAVRATTLTLVPEPDGDEPPFNGHLTLARAKKGLSTAARGALAGIRFEAEFEVAHVDLVCSTPSPNGHIYTTLSRAPIGPGPGPGPAAGP